MRPALAIVALTSLLATSLACSAGPFADVSDGEDTGRTGNDTDADTGSGGVSVDETWGIGGTITLEADALVSAAPTLQTRNPACSVDGTLDTVTPLPSLTVDGVTLRLGWTVTASRGEGATCTPDTPATFVIGIGPTDASLSPAANKAGLDATHAYGLYLQTGNGPLYLVGLVGTEGQLAGTEDPTDGPPLADGTYRMVTLFGVPVRP